MKRLVSDNYRLFIAASVLCGCIAFAWLLYLLFGHQLIGALVKSQSLWILEGVVAGRAVTSLENYYTEADRLMRAGTLWTVILFAALTLLVKLHLLGKMILIALSFIVSSFTIFSIFEIYPSLIEFFHLDRIEYYAHQRYYISDPTLIYRNKPSYNAVAYNFKGDKYSPEFGIEVTPKTIVWVSDREGFRNSRMMESADVIVIGDSYIEYGYDEDDTFPKRLDKKLPGIVVANLGTAGYGPFQYLEVLKRYGIKKQPKYAIMGFFEGNDVVDIREYIAWRMGYGYHATDVSLSSSYLKRYTVALTSTSRYIVNLIRANVSLLIKEIDVWKMEVYQQPNVAVLSLGSKNYSKVFFGKFGRGYHKPTDEILMTDEWIELKKVLIDYKKVCEDNGIIPILVYIPTDVHIYASHSTHASGKKWLEIREEQLILKDKVEEAMRRLAQEIHLELISLTPIFQTAAKGGELLYDPLDTHWSSEGREVAATYIAHMLQEKFMLSSKEVRN